MEVNEIEFTQVKAIKKIAVRKLETIKTTEGVLYTPDACPVVE